MLIAVPRVTKACSHRRNNITSFLRISAAGKDAWTWTKAAAVEINGQRAAEVVDIST